MPDFDRTQLRQLARDAILLREKATKGPWIRERRWVESVPVSNATGSVAACSEEATADFCVAARDAVDIWPEALLALLDATEESHG